MTAEMNMNRRRFVACFSSLGLGSTLMPGALAAVAEDATTITPEMIEAAQKIAGLSFTPAQQLGLLERLNGERSPLNGFAAIRAAGLRQRHSVGARLQSRPAGKAPSDGNELDEAECRRYLDAIDG